MDVPVCFFLFFFLIVKDKTNEYLHLLFLVRIDQTLKQVDVETHTLKVTLATVSLIDNIMWMALVIKIFASRGRASEVYVFN